jgi:hypothetical protein
MPLTAHDAEERSRQIIGRVMDAQEKVSDTQDHALDGPEQARAHLVALRELVNRQDDLIAELREQVRQAVS